MNGNICVLTTRHFVILVLLLRIIFVHCEVHDDRYDTRYDRYIPIDRSLANGYVNYNKFEGNNEDFIHTIDDDLSSSESTHQPSSTLNDISSSTPQSEDLLVNMIGTSFWNPSNLTAGTTPEDVSETADHMDNTTEFETTEIKYTADETTDSQPVSTTTDSAPATAEWEGDGQCVGPKSLDAVKKEYDFIRGFDRLFGELERDMHRSLLNDGDIGSINTVLFVGNTGAGKSTLVQLLSGDNTKLIAMETAPDSGEFVIFDEGRISWDTTRSKTLYPEMIFDNQTNTWLCDNPGFKDTRSPAHEIITTYAMKAILQKSKNLKIVLTITHASLQKGMYRDDLTNLLRHLASFVIDISKYKDSIFLIGTKVENTVTRKGKNFVLVSEQTIIRNIANFLTEVKSAMIEDIKSGNSKIDDKEIFFNKATMVIDSLISIHNKNKYGRINIFRKPQESGPLSESAIIQDERTSIREMLLGDSNFVRANFSDFGYSISDNAKVYLNELFECMDRYIAAATEIAADALLNSLKSIRGLSKIDVILEKLDRNKAEMDDLFARIKDCENPGEFFNEISKTLSANDVHLCGSYTADINELNTRLKSLETLTKSTKYTSVLWRSKLNSVREYLDNEYEYYSTLKHIYGRLTSYEIQKENQLRSNNLDGFIIEDEDSPETANDKLNSLMDKLGLNKLDDIRLDAHKIKIYNKVIEMTSQADYSITCDDDNLLVVGQFIRSTQINTYVAEYPQCAKMKNVIILSSHTFFIDSNMDDEFFQGKDMLIMAAVWDVRGFRAIKIDGKDRPEVLPKAQDGQVGLDGLAGGPGGNFFGFGLRFENGEELTVSSKGGDGQRGQDGGDGRDGADGPEGIEPQVVDNRVNFHLIFFSNYVEDVVVRGMNGQRGGNSGSGGRGGRGGAGGSIEIVNLGESGDHGIKIWTESGRDGGSGGTGAPGKGGSSGCTTEYERRNFYLFGFRVHTSVQQVEKSCPGRSVDGSVRLGRRKQDEQDSDAKDSELSICDYACTFVNKLLPYSKNILTHKMTKDIISNIQIKIDNCNCLMSLNY